jgi:hypothetical protein
MVATGSQHWRAVLLVCVGGFAGCGGGGSESSPPPSGGGSINSPPVISGHPPEAVVAGRTYVFQPNASDQDGDRLVYSISNPPPSANFNSSTGRLTWSPTTAHIGKYSNITISVSDGKETVSLPAFAIEVLAVGTGVAEISWAAPTQNTDGTPLTDLAGYEIHYGQSPSALTEVESVSTAGTTTYVIDGLARGSWYFSVVARNSRGLTSPPSEIVSKVIN